MRRADFDDRLADYLEGDLPLEDRALVDAYLDTDPEAARELHELRRTIALLRDLPDPTPPADLAARVLRRIEAGEGRPGLWDRAMGMLSAPAVVRFAAPMAAAAGVAGVAWVTGQIPWTEEGARAPALQVARAPERPVAPVSPRVLELTRAPERVLAIPEPARPAARSEVGSSLASGSRSVAPGTPRISAPSAGVLASRSERREVLPGSELAPAVPVSREPVADLPGVFARTEPGGSLLQTFDRSPTPVPLASSESREAKGQAELDARLELMVQRPAELASLLARDSLAAEELWMKALAARALERSIAEEILDALAASPELEARQLHAIFRAAVESARAEVVAREAGAPEPTATPAP